MTKKITRSTVNEEQYNAPRLATSGFAMSYRRYTSFMLGRIHVGGFHFTMPGDKISGRTSSNNLTFNRLVTPIISPVNAMQYNIFLPLRPLDRSFKKGITPTKLNAMSANWSMPTCNTSDLVNKVLTALYQNLDYTVGSAFDKLLQTLGTDADMPINVAQYDAGQSVFDNLYAYDNLIGIPVRNLTTNGSDLCNMADALYLRDALLDIAANITAKLGSSTNPIDGNMTVKDFFNLFLSTLLEPWLGRYSYYGEFKYEYIRPWDFYRIANGLISSALNYSTFLAAFSSTPQNEYPLRAIYAIWYELFRNVDLEPVSATLPDWQEFSTTSIFDLANGGNLCYLIYRIRPWEKDMFISAQIDDLSRHVYAPVINSSSNASAYHDQSVNNLDANSNINWRTRPLPSSILLSYRDQLSESNTSITCPIPSNINDVLSAADATFRDVYGLDLNTLRQSQMLEKYLKRNYLFGDEYQDRMLAHYNSRVSDMRINKPEILSQSMDGYNMKQEVSNVSTSAGTNIGDRTATATIQINGNEFTTFCEEFGIVISLVTFMPRSMYDGTTPQLYMNKQIHLPIPEFASMNEEFGRKSEISGTSLAPVGVSAADDNRYIFGRYPAYHAWRSRVDEVGGMFLDELQDCTFRRFFGMFSDDTTPKLNYFFIHCRPNLDMFASNVLYDSQIYGDLVHDCYVERVLPTPVETI